MFWYFTFWFRIFVCGFVRLDTNNITADPDEDYEHFVNKTETFNPGGSYKIDVPISINGDDLVENNETFSVTLLSQSSPELVVADPNNTIITIVESDGKYMLFAFLMWYSWNIYFSNS